MFDLELIKNYPEAITFLTNAIIKNKLANSYIFIGKDINDITRVALNLAKILNCEKNKNIKPCNNCINCRWLERKEHPQAFIEISPDQKGKKEQITIDTIRELLSTLQTTSDFYRVIFLKNSNLQYLPQESCNLLLKPVEEASKRTIFIFANNTKNDILPTILSRSQVIYLNKKYDSINQLIGKEQFEIKDKELTNCFSKDLENSLSKAKKAHEYLEKNKTNLKDYLIGVASTNYEADKYLNPAQYCKLYENLTMAYRKHKSFMQTKIVIEDLFLNLVKS